MSTNSSNIVAEWLRSLQLGQYAESFLDNGYDDLEICKQVGDPDLDAIGVFNPSHRVRLLESVRTLRETGAARVYFTLEQAAGLTTEPVAEEKEVRASSRSSSLSNDSAKAKFKDEYEEGRAELLKIPRVQLKTLVREELAKDGVRLSSHPYSTETGERGYLEGLASRYADRFSTHYSDVLEHLEELRKKEWDDTPVKIVPCDNYGVDLHPLSSSISQPIYVPGKYSPSSCLSDKEEDEIYGFAGYGVYGKQMRQRQQQQQRILLANQQAAFNYQSCLSPRSAFFYEFPPTGEALGATDTSKKKTSFAKFLRGLKTVHRKEKHGASSPRRAVGGPPNTRVGTPDSLLDGPMLPLPAMDPRMIHYDQLRVLQMNGSQYNFEETINRLKIQDALKKKERIHREHEEILRDIRHGLLQLGRGTAGSSDDTYMYDEDVRALAPHHWYDEPPYESDPEDFLMGVTSQPSATIQNGRVCFTLNMRTDRTREGVLSHPSAGDISIPNEGSWTRGRAPRRGLILPQAGPYPPTIIPLTHARSCRESGDYAGSDVQSLSSRLSSFSVDTAKSEPQARGDPRGVSDYDEHDLPSPPGDNVVPHRRRGKKHQEGRHQEQSSGKSIGLPSTSSAESLPSGSGSSTQALVRETSGHSSLSAGDDRDGVSPIGPAPQGAHIANGPVIARARALVDCTPNPYDREALRFQKGDVIEVLQMSASGLWQGRAHGRTGLFKFINVELLGERMPRRSRTNRRNKPRTVEELLKRIGMEEHTSVFVLNGYEDVDLFQDLESQDLDFLGIRDPEHRAKILTAVQLLHDYDSAGEADNGDTSSDESLGSTSRSSKSTTKKSSSLKNLRDSGCYEEEAMNKRRIRGSTGTKTLAAPNNLDGKNIFAAGMGKSKPKSKQCPENVEMEVLSTKVNYHPNIPFGDYKKNTTKEFFEQTREVLDRAREIAHNSREILERGASNPISGGETSEKDACETNTKMATAKYAVAGFGEMGNDAAAAGFSERSSDSGISSSSMSSTQTSFRAVPLLSPKTRIKPSCDKSKVGQILEKIESTNPFLNNSLGEARRCPDSPNRNFQNVSFPSSSLVLQKKT